MSEISRDALWAAVEAEEAAVCKKCKAPAVYHIRRELGPVYACAEHAISYLGQPSTVRPL